LTNASVYTTLQQFQALENAATPRDKLNWRFQQALYRAYYDAFIRSRLIYETHFEDEAMDILRKAGRTGTLKALVEAEAVLDRAVTKRVSAAARQRPTFAGCVRSSAQLRTTNPRRPRAKWTG